MWLSWYIQSHQDSSSTYQPALSQLRSLLESLKRETSQCAISSHDCVTSQLGYLIRSLVVLELDHTLAGRSMPGEWFTRSVYTLQATLEKLEVYRASKEDGGSVVTAHLGQVCDNLSAIRNELATAIEKRERIMPLTTRKPLKRPAEK